MGWLFQVENFGHAHPVRFTTRGRSAVGWCVRSDTTTAGIADLARGSDDSDLDLDGDGTGTGADLSQLLSNWD